MGISNEKFTSLTRRQNNKGAKRGGAPAYTIIRSLFRPPYSLFEEEEEEEVVAEEMYASGLGRLGREAEFYPQLIQATVQSILRRRMAKRK